jgi:uncharacterized cupin superfamily protein
VPQAPRHSGGITHFDDAPSNAFALGHLQGRWTMLGEAAGSVSAGVRRIEVPPGGWSTPAHDHGAEEEIFFVLSGRGVSWHAGATTEIRTGDCIVYLPRAGAHTLHAETALDVLAFGTRRPDNAIAFPRLGMSLVGPRATESMPRAIDGKPFQFVRESELGPPELPDPPGPRPATIVGVDDIEPESVERARIRRERRNLGRAAGSVQTGIQHVTVWPGYESAPLHCHSHEEEIFVILEGEGTLVLGRDVATQTETPVRPGHVIARPAGTAVAHMFRAGEDTLRYLAYGTREPGDMCFYPRSNKVAFRGVGVIARLEQLDYWDGED